MTSRLTATVVPPERSAWNAVELELLVDGRDLVGSVFEYGPRRDPDELLGPASPLLPTDEPREVMLAEAECTEGCCGAIYVRVRRDGDHVVWDQWRNPDAEDLPLAEVRFDAAQYEAELARADHDRGWEWPARTVARLVAARLRAEPAGLGRWNSSLAFVNALPDSRGEIGVSFVSPSAQVIDKQLRTAGRPVPFTQFRLRLPVSAEPVERQAERIVARLLTTDPRTSADIVGGYAQNQVSGS